MQYERTAIQARREREYHDYREYSRYQLQEDEVSFAGEAIRAYKKNELHFERLGDDFVVLDPDGSLVSLLETTQNSAEHYKELAQDNPEFWWQAARTELESAHIRHALGMQPGEMRLVISDCPEEELERHGKNVFGYQGGDVKLGFFQLFYVDARGNLTIYGHSFEQNDPKALDAVYAMFGRTRTDGAWALAQPIDDSIEGFDPELLLDRIVATYDISLHDTRGGEWFAGRQNVASDDEEANAFVRRQTDLLDEHLQKLEAVGPKSDQANSLRYDFAVAIRRRYEGKTTNASYESAGAELAAEGVLARQSGESVDGCGLSLGVQNSTERSLVELGMQTLAESWHFGQCQVCLKDGMVGVCSVCAHCEAADNHGKDLAAIHAAALADVASKTSRAVSPELARVKAGDETTLARFQAIVAQNWGDGAVVKKRIDIGRDAFDVVRDSEVIAADIELGRFALAGATR